MINDSLYATTGDNRFIFMGINNRVGSSCLFVLSPDSCYGASPPYSDPHYDLESVRRGNQINYILFPPADLNRHYELLYNEPDHVDLELDDRIRVGIDEVEAG